MNKEQNQEQELDTALDVVDLGDAKELTLGPWSRIAEENLTAPYRLQ
jgi:hypothetical protein